MSLQSLAAALLLPPLLFVLVALAAPLLMRRRWCVTLLVMASMVGVLLLATPFVAGKLRTSLERHVVGAIPSGSDPRAIVILAAEAAPLADGGIVPGPLSLERLEAGARLARRAGLPVLITGGPLSADAPPIAEVMAGTLKEVFGIIPRWVETAARDTAENARNSAALLGREGISAAYIVTHGWHMPRSVEAFGRTGLVVFPFPTRISRNPDGRVTDWIPRPDHLAESWFMIREWAGLVLYRLRDG
ncbi:YdcF family protein [Elioraea rosea]|uniref:YdcF family protein n=1 Tax=Elioraea rosea TaxID=2492390 RepID=UPI0013150B46|nr:YdcF family protein [Elioraea rosea]